MEKHPTVYLLDGQPDAWGFFSERSRPDTPSMMSLAMGQWWRPFPDDFPLPIFELEPDEEGRQRPELDVSCFHNPFIILSEKAVLALRDILESSGRVMPVKTSVQGRLFFGFYPSYVVNCYDSANAFYDTLAAGPLIYDPALKGGALPAEEVFFTIPEDPEFIFFTDQVRQRIEAAGLNGFDFSRTVPVA